MMTSSISSSGRPYFNASDRQYHDVAEQVRQRHRDIYGGGAVLRKLYDFVDLVHFIEQRRLEFDQSIHHVRGQRRLGVSGEFVHRVHRGDALCEG